MKLEERICACGCRKTFRCLPSSGTRYSSLHCMEAAGALPPVDKFGRGTKPPRTEVASPVTAPKLEVKPAPKAEAPKAAKGSKAAIAAVASPKKESKSSGKKGKAEKTGSKRPNEAHL